MGLWAIFMLLQLSQNICVNVSFARLSSYSIFLNELTSLCFMLRLLWIDGYLTNLLVLILA
jgi:hypothetical protein